MKIVAEVMCAIILGVVPLAAAGCGSGAGNIRYSEPRSRRMPPLEIKGNSPGSVKVSNTSGNLDALLVKVIDSDGNVEDQGADDDNNVTVDVTEDSKRLEIWIDGRTKKITKEQLLQGHP